MHKPDPDPDAVPAGNLTATPASLSGTISVAGSSSVGPHIEGDIKPAPRHCTRAQGHRADRATRAPASRRPRPATADIGMSSRDAEARRDGADLIGDRDRLRRYSGHREQRQRRYEPLQAADRRHLLGQHHQLEGRGRQRCGHRRHRAKPARAPGPRSRSSS